MVVTLRTAVCVAAIMCFADTAPAIAKKARLVCEYGRCWQTGAGYDYQYGYRPPTKWELKGFCPPGQAKKGQLLSESSEPPHATAFRNNSGGLAIFTAILRALSNVPWAHKQQSRRRGWPTALPCYQSELGQ